MLAGALVLERLDGVSLRRYLMNIGTASNHIEIIAQHYISYIYIKYTLKDDGTSFIIRLYAHTHTHSQPGEASHCVFFFISGAANGELIALMTSRHMTALRNKCAEQNYN